jgi:Lar family restriction alleviation protein
MTNNTLLPCPFCGGEAEITRYGTQKVSTVYDCTNCGCSLETGETTDFGKQWNTRKNLSKT